MILPCIHAKEVHWNWWLALRSLKNYFVATCICMLYMYIATRVLDLRIGMVALVNEHFFYVYLINDCVTVLLTSLCLIRLSYSWIHRHCMLSYSYIFVEKDMKTWGTLAFGVRSGMSLRLGIQWYDSGHGEKFYVVVKMITSTIDYFLLNYLWFYICNKTMKQQWRDLIFV